MKSTERNSQRSQNDESSPIRHSPRKKITASESSPFGRNSPFHEFAKGINQNASNQNMTPLFMRDENSINDENSFEEHHSTETESYCESTEVNNESQIDIDEEEEEEEEEDIIDDDEDDILHVSEPFDSDNQNEQPNDIRSSSSRLPNKLKESQSSNLLNQSRHTRNKSEANFPISESDQNGPKGRVSRSYVFFYGRPLPVKLGKPLILIDKVNPRTKTYHFEPDFEPEPTEIPTNIQGFSPEQQFDKLLRIKQNQDFFFTDDPRQTYHLVMPSENNIGSAMFEPSLLPTCNVCKKKINERFYFAHGFSYHPNCLKCSSCNRHLCPPNCYFLRDMPYCKYCINMKKSQPPPNRCPVCNLYILNQKDAITPDCYDKPIHRNCLRCYVCSNEITDFSLVSGKPVCGKCIQELTENQMICNKCGKVILERSVLFHGLHFHPEHFLCTECHCILKGQNYVVYRNKPYCPIHGEAFATRKCWVCHQDFNDDQKVIKWSGRAYHASCFKCKECNKILNEDNWIRVHGNPYCEACYQNYKDKKEQKLHTQKLVKDKTKPVLKKKKKAVKKVND